MSKCAELSLLDFLCEDHQSAGGTRSGQRSTPEKHSFDMKRPLPERVKREKREKELMKALKVERGKREKALKAEGEKWEEPLKVEKEIRESEKADASRKYEYLRSHLLEVEETALDTAGWITNNVCHCSVTCYMISDILKNRTRNYSIGSSCTIF